MSPTTHLKGLWPIVRWTAAAIGMTAAIVVVMMWLMGVFEPKIEEGITVQPAR